MALTSLLTILTLQAKASGTVGLGVGIADKAGMLNSKLPVIAPALWFEVSALPDFRTEFEVLAFSVEQGGRKTTYRRASVWLERRAEFLIFHQAFDLASGLGWSYLSRSGGSDRGVLGFRAGLGYPFQAFGDRTFDVGIRYSGTPWAGSGAVEDRIELAFSAFLFGKPKESNTLP